MRARTLKRCVAAECARCARSAVAQLFPLGVVLAQEMERFKVLEKETKTKAYSTQALQNSARSQKKDKDTTGPKADVLGWLDKARGKLKSQLSGFEKQVDAFKTSKGGKAKGKDGDFKQMQHFVDRHTHHLHKLKLMKLRLKEDLLSADQVLC